MRKLVVLILHSLFSLRKAPITCIGVNITASKPTAKDRTNTTINTSWICLQLCKQCVYFKLNCTLTIFHQFALLSFNPTDYGAFKVGAQSKPDQL